nr:hypothetical protein [Tanacetum cinerariifolium]
SLSMGYEHLSITPETESDEVTESNVDASVPNPAIVSVEEENVVQREEEEERLINFVDNDNSDNSSNDPLLEEVDLFLFDDSIPPGIENVADDPEGDVRFLEELLIDDSIISHESSDSNFEDNPSISRPPPEPPGDNFDLEPERVRTQYLTLLSPIRSSGISLGWNFHVFSFVYLNSVESPIESFSVPIALPKDN